MGAKSSALANDLVEAVFLGTDPTWRATAGQANLYLALHTAAPAVGDSQTSHECAYTGYARVAVARADGWDVAADTASNAADVTFPAATDPADDETATHVSVGLLASGAGQVLYVAELVDGDGDPDPQRIVLGLAVRFEAGELTFQET